jgi:NAD(P)H-flavin reductase
MAPTLERPIAGGLMADPMLPLPYRVRRLRHETHDTFTLELVPTEDGAGTAFAPGQFNMLYVFGVGEVPISISGDPRDSSSLQHTTRAVGAVTKAMRRIKRGDTIGVRGPFGSHWPLVDAVGHDVVIVAGGIGLPPLRSALYHLFAHRKKYGNVVLLYGARTPDDIVYQSELERWRESFNLDVHVTVDFAPSGWRGSVGAVTALIGRTSFNPSNVMAMMCGPEVMMRFTVMELQKRGVSMDHIYLSTERNMKCAIGFCGRCQYGSTFVCKDGPVFRLDRIASIFGKAEI